MIHCSMESELGGWQFPVSLLYLRCLPIYDVEYLSSTTLHACTRYVHVHDVCILLLKKLSQNSGIELLHSAAFAQRQRLLSPIMYLLRGVTTIDSVLIRCVSRLDAAEEEPTLGWAIPILGKVPRYLGI